MSPEANTAAEQRDAPDVKPLVLEEAGSDDDDTSLSSHEEEQQQQQPTKKSTSTKAATGIIDDKDTAPTFDFRTFTEWICFITGLIILVCCGPPVGAVIFAAMVWEACDRNFRGGFVDSKCELSGFIFAKCVPWLEQTTRKFNSKFVKRSDDAYMVNCIVAYGVIVPMLFGACAWYTYTNHGRINYGLAFLYHLVRIGPFFMNFAYVYTLCHKEGHSRSGLYSQPYNNSVFIRNVFNWWVGMFYGVLPATFAYGHSINHHRYNNGPLDIISTADKPRDSFVNWVAYLPRYLLYAVNVSTIQQFWSEGNYKVVRKTFVGTVYFFIWLAINAYVISPTFCIAYVAFPFFEATLLLSAVNWSWHAFLDPNDPTNEYVQSITILDGCINVLNEDFHVVHHQVPGAHWTDHPKHVQKLWDQYIENRASCFRTTHAFEIFGMSVARDYDALASKFVDLHGEKDGNTPLTHDEKVALMKERLRGCWWGPRVVNDENMKKKAPTTSTKKQD